MLIVNRTAKQIVGQKGEDLACKHLEKLGFSIVERNYWRPWGEIDIVARKGKELRFVEVKTVSREKLPEINEDYEPEDNLHPWKLKRLRRVIETYLLANDWVDGEDLDWQVDAVLVYLQPSSGGVLKIDILEDLAI